MGSSNLSLIVNPGGKGVPVHIHLPQTSNSHGKGKFRAIEKKQGAPTEIILFKLKGNNDLNPETVTKNSC